ncbi:MAG: peptidoglycan editing factor PgeF [Pseudomonadota bacterium]
MHPDWIIPDWPAPPNVRGVMTTRSGGVSRPPYDSLNPAGHVGDDPAAVAENRRILRQSLPAEPLWLNQVHGSRVIELVLPARGGGQGEGPGLDPSTSWPLAGAVTPEADASFTRQPGQVCAVLTADCLPVLFCDDAGRVVAAAHAGWRGLAGGVLENTVAAMGVEPARILAWLGAAIGPDTFEVGPEVREAFLARHPLAGIAFRPALPGTLDETPRKWLADIYVLARLLLAQAGVEQVYGGGMDTFRDVRRFHSYRRDGPSGRMASLVWLG